MMCNFQLNSKINLRMLLIRDNYKVVNMLSQIRKLNKIDREIEDALLNLIKVNSNSHVVAIVAELFGKFKIKRALPFLIMNLRRKEYFVRTKCLHALANIGRIESIETIASIMKNDLDPYIKCIALEALNKYENNKIIDYLFEALFDSNNLLSKCALELLSLEKNKKKTKKIAKNMQKSNLSSFKKKKIELLFKNLTQRNIYLLDNFI